jgi:hypothetical protein
MASNALAVAAQKAMRVVLRVLAVIGIFPPKLGRFCLKRSPLVLRLINR